MKPDLRDSVGHAKRFVLHFGIKDGEIQKYLRIVPLIAFIKDNIQEE